MNIDDYVYKWPQMPDFRADFRVKCRVLDYTPMTSTERAAAFEAANADLRQIEAAWKAPHTAAELELASGFRSALEREYGVADMSWEVRDFCWTHATNLADSESDRSELYYGARERLYDLDVGFSCMARLVNMVRNAIGGAK